MKHKFDNTSNTKWSGFGLAVFAGGALLGASFLGSEANGSPAVGGGYDVLTLPEAVAPSPFLDRGIRKAQDAGYYCYYYTGYYDCCFDTEDGQYCCYYYGYYYCYDSPQKSSENRDGPGFIGHSTRPEMPRAGMNVGGFAPVERAQRAGVPSHDGSAMAGSGVAAVPAEYNNTFY